jgi:hypothetical protein
MGENYLHEQVENSKKRRDQIRQDLEQPQLLTRPEFTDVVYNIVPDGDEQLRNGETLLAVAAKDGERIDLLRNNVKVGTIQGEGARKLYGEVSKPENVHAVCIRIENVSKLSGGADGRLVKE